MLDITQCPVSANMSDTDYALIIQSNKLRKTLKKNLSVSIDDTKIEENATWSSEKINQEIETLAENIKQIQTSGYGKYAYIDTTIQAKGMLSSLYGLYTVEESEGETE